tara:strand:- start:1170 stop:2288 length:1119 start_codon:yes stop_codon:yes gene_type:complete
MKRKKIIPYVNLGKDWTHHKKKLLKIIDKTLSTGNWVGGDEIDIFEKNISKFCDCKYAVGLNSGTDALVLGLHLLGVRKGDEVITTPNSFIASTAAIIHIGAKPVFVDVCPDQNIDVTKIETAINKKTKAIMPVHLTGRVSQMDKIIELSKKYNIPIIEDAAQSVGAKFKNKKAGSFGEIGCFSAHPLKNLNAIGDSGYLITNNILIYKKAKNLINHGMKNREVVTNFGYVSRMDNLQAAVLNYRLKNLNQVILARRKNASIYKKLLNKNFVFIPAERKEEFNTYHTFVVQLDKRDKLKKYLEDEGILTSIHYPRPIHLQPAARILKYKKNDFKTTESQSKKILSLPINQFLLKEDIVYICNKINYFYKSHF